MTSASHPGGRDSATDGMGGHGYYDGHSDVQRSVAQRQDERLRNAVRHLDLDVPELRIIDFGCGPGRNSMAAFFAVLDEVREARAAMPVVAVHNDQAGNDWNGLFANINGPGGYFAAFPTVRAEASVGNFFRSVASPGTIDLGMSFMAAHWLDGAVRLRSPGSLFFCDIQEPARREIAARAERDWMAFFRARAQEIKSGGWLVVETLSSVPDPNDRSGLLAAGRKNYRAVYRVAEALARKGRIGADALDEYVFPVYFRDDREARAPFERDGDLKDAFEIVELTNELYPTPVEEALKRDGDVEAYAATYAAYVRAYSESTLRKGLFEPSTSSPGETDALADLFYNRLRQLFLDEPGKHASETQSMTLVLRRR